MKGKSTDTVLDRPKYHTTPDGAIVVDAESLFRVKKVREQVKLLREIGEMERDLKRRSREAGE